MKLPLLSDWRLERRAVTGRALPYRVGAVALGVLVSLLVGVSLSATSSSGYFNYLWTGTFGSGLGIGQVATLAFPLIFLGLAASIPLRVGLWNIGGDGQLFLGAWGAYAVGLLFPHLAGPMLVVLMLLAAMIFGGLWTLFPALVRVYLGVNEIITTLLFNFVAGYWVVYWAAGPWREPLSAGGVESKQIPLQTQVAPYQIGGAGIPFGFFLAIAIAGASWFVFRKTTFGYKIDVLGASTRTAQYIGLSTKKLLVFAMLIGGAMAGLAGATEMLGVVDRYAPSLSNNTGYIGIVVAILAGGSELAIVIVSILFACITISGNILQVTGASSDLIFAMFGITLIFAALGQGFAHVKLVRRRTGPAFASQDEVAPIREGAS